MDERPIFGTLKWTLIGFVVAGFLFVGYHLLFHSEPDGDVHSTDSAMVAPL